MRYLTISKGGIWYFRFQLPTEHQHLFDNRNEIKRSLRTSSKNEAKIQALSLELAIRTKIQECTTHTQDSPICLPQPSISSPKRRLLGDDAKFIGWRYGNVTDSGELEKLAIKEASRNRLTKSDTRKFIKAICATAETAVLDHIKYHNHRDKLEIEVDMFTDESYISLHADYVRAHFEHIDYQAPLTSYNDEIIEDYKDHFKELDDVLSSIIASRFATHNCAIRYLLSA